MFINFIKFFQGLYSCVSSMTLIVPEQLALFKDKCEGKSSCVAEACPDYWDSTKQICDQKAMVWIIYRSV